MALLDEILAEIRSSGPLTFARYMEACLYHPALGYYRSGRPKLGREGDFYTSAHVHRGFARLLVRGWNEMWQALGGGEFTVVEPGAGGGEIAREAQAWAAREFPEFSRVLRYIPLEYGATLPDPFTGCVFSNEFFDAQPVHVVRRVEGELRELYVTEQNGTLAWLAGPLSTPELDAWLSRLHIELAEGRTIEISLQAAEWMRRFAAALRDGYVVSIDYGYRVRELTRGQRFPAGSLMSYRRHAASNDVLRDPGDRDLTAHVNWDLLIAAGEQAGLRETTLMSQSAYLMRLGEASRFSEFYADVDRPLDRMNASLLLKNLLFGIGETMQVLEQRRVRRVLSPLASKTASE